jgi:hypothetical protein
MDLEGWAVELLTLEPTDAEADLTLEYALAAVEEAVHLLPHRLRHRPPPE